MPQVLCPVVVGRDEELAALGSALAGAEAGRGGCAVLTGEPGIGKSRLAREVTACAADRGFTVATGRAVPSSANASYRPLTEALLGLLRERALPADAGFAPWRPALAALLPGLVASEGPPDEVSPAIRGEAVLQLLRRVAGKSLLLLEDLHWADPDTLAAVEYLADTLANEAILAVLTLRDAPPSPALELAHRQRGRPGLLHLPLARLAPADVVSMVRACAPGADERLVARVQEAAEGLPLLAEEVLAAPGLPRSFAESVTQRLLGLPADEHCVIEAAAVLGRQFDWELLPAVTGTDEATVAAALGRGVSCQLLTTDGATVRFRHALTREAVLAEMLPPRRRELAAAALAALDGGGRAGGGGRRELAADLAERAGDPVLAAALLVESGQESLGRGALATAIDTLRHAADLLEGSAGRATAERPLIEALALAGRVDEAADVGNGLVEELGDAAATAEQRAEVHLRLAQAGVAAARWPMATEHARRARQLAGARPPAATEARIGVLEADVSFAAGDVETAQRLAERVLTLEGAEAGVRCHAFEIVGRRQRLGDLEAARATFAQALRTATDAGLPIWRMRALHELGTIDLFDHAGTERLTDARRTAEAVGALSTVAVLDLQLSAAHTCRWELDESDARSRSAVAMAERLGLGAVRAKALALLAGTASMRVDRGEMERYLEESRVDAPEDPFFEAFAWGCRGMLELLAGGAAAAAAPFERGMALFARLPHAEPAALRAVWPVVLASLGDRRAGSAVEEARRLGVASSNLNRGLIGYAEAILAGRAGQRRRAGELVVEADGAFVNCGLWRDVARLLAAPSAASDGWGEPRRWLPVAADRVAGKGLERLAGTCRQLLATEARNPWAAAGVTAREADVLRLVIEACSNKEIAARLQLSARTVEKHVESLLRKMEARSRTELAVAASRSAGPVA